MKFFSFLLSWIKLINGLRYTFYYWIVCSKNWLIRPENAWSLAEIKRVTSWVTFYSIKGTWLQHNFVVFIWISQEQEIEIFLIIFRYSFIDMDDWEEYFEFYVEGLLLFITGVFGVIGNIVFIIILSCRRQDINTFHR